MQPSAASRTSCGASNQWWTKLRPMTDRQGTIATLVLLVLVATVLSWAVVGSTDHRLSLSDELACMTGVRVWQITSVGPRTADKPSGPGSGYEALPCGRRPSPTLKDAGTLYCDATLRHPALNNDLANCS